MGIIEIISGFGKKINTYPVKCAKCGKIFENMFLPMKGKPVYCPDCMKEEGKTSINLVDNLFREIAKSLKIKSDKIIIRSGFRYQLVVLKDLIFDFNAITYPRRGLIILMRDSKTRKPTELGPYTEKDITDKARKEILAKIIQISK